jgi:serine/threonine protein kinase
VHESCYLHRDLKSGNILLERTPEGGRQVRLGDFGLAKYLETLNSVARTAGLGTPGSQPPEVLQDGVAQSTGFDIWCVALVFWEMCIGHHPWAQVGANKLRQV